MSKFRYKATDLGWDWREKIAKGKQKGVIQCRVKVEVEPGALNEFIARLNNVGAGLDDAEVSLESRTFYGDEDSYIAVEGWRDATPEEITARRSQLEAAAQSAQQSEEWLIESLRKRRPELFKE